MDNEKWKNAFNEQLMLHLSIGKLLYSEKKKDVELKITKHKYFAFRVSDILLVESDISLLKSHAAQGARELARVIDRDIKTFIEKNKIKGVDAHKVVFFISTPLRLQSAYDLDYLSTSVVGDIEYTIGFANTP